VKSAASPGWASLCRERQTRNQTQTKIFIPVEISAECLGWQDSVGTIEAGKLADVVIVKTNPLQDIRSLENNDNIVFVMKDGKGVKDVRSSSK
jgi:cytosine/adenosine deaminase-related metal-dependent hydrolase